MLPPRLIIIIITNHRLFPSAAEPRDGRPLFDDGDNQLIAFLPSSVRAPCSVYFLSSPLAQVFVDFVPTAHDTSPWRF